MHQYLELIRDILEHGVRKEDRTGTGTVSVFGRQLRFNLEDGFPLVTTKKLHVPSIIHELLWFVSGSTNVRYLRENGVSIWDEWADAEGELGPVYGKQWRAWETQDAQSIDQLGQLMNELRSNPNSRRLLISAWNPGQVKDMALPPCHYSFQFHVEQERRLSCLFNMRSVDVFLGLPFNVASYALLTYMVAQQCDLEPHELIWSGGDTHLYLNHLEQAHTQLKREPYPLPKLKLLRRPTSLFEYRFEDFEIEGYQAHPHIKAPVAI